MKKSELRQIIKEEIYKAMNEENWSSSPGKPVIHEKELVDFFEGLIELNSTSKKITTQYNLKPSTKIDSYHFTDNTGAIYFNYKLGDTAAKLRVGISINKKSELSINSWTGEGASLRRPNKELRIPLTLKANAMSELTLAMIQKEIKKAAPIFNKYINNTIDVWASMVDRERNFYRGRKGGSGVGDLA